MTGGKVSDATDEHPEVWTAANIVTIVRIVLIPLFVFLILAPWPDWMGSFSNADAAKPWIAAGFFIILSATDGVDGYLARKRNEITTLGKFLDPIADKILICAALLALIELGTLPSWIVLIIIAREFIVSGLRMMAAYGGVVIAASWYGKWKTFTTMVAVVLFIVKDSSVVLSAGAQFAYWFNIASWAIMILALILTIVSMVDYFAKTESSLHLFSSSSKGR